MFYPYWHWLALSHHSCVKPIVVSPAQRMGQKIWYQFWGNVCLLKGNRAFADLRYGEEDCNSRRTQIFPPTQG